MHPSSSSAPLHLPIMPISYQPSPSLASSLQIPTEIDPFEAIYHSYRYGGLGYGQDPSPKTVEASLSSASLCSAISSSSSSSSLPSSSNQPISSHSPTVSSFSSSSEASPVDLRNHESTFVNYQANSKTDNEMDHIPHILLGLSRHAGNAKYTSVSVFAWMNLFHSIRSHPKK